MNDFLLYVTGSEVETKVNSHLSNTRIPFSFTKFYFDVKNKKKEFIFSFKLVCKFSSKV